MNGRVEVVAVAKLVSDVVELGGGAVGMGRGGAQAPQQNAANHVTVRATADYLDKSIKNDKQNIPNYDARRGNTDNIVSQISTGKHTTSLQKQHELSGELPITPRS